MIDMEGRVKRRDVLTTGEKIEFADGQSGYHHWGVPSEFVKAEIELFIALCKVYILACARI